MTDVYLEDLTYSKPEVDTKFTEERVYTDAEVVKKLDLSQKGSPSGVASLNSEGDVNREQLPIASHTEAMDDSNESKLITPESLHYVLVANEYMSKPDADSSYGDLRSDGSVEMGAAYNPQDLKDIATVEYVQAASSGASHSFVVDTQAEMLLLTGIKTGDTCFVTAEVDPLDNGEFVAKVDDPVDISGWAERESKTAWGGIIGTLSDQTDLQAEFTAITDKTDLISVTQAINLDTVVSNVTTDLITTYDGVSVDIVSSDGTDATIDAAIAGGDAGVMTGADKTELTAATADIVTQEGRLDQMDTLNTNQGTAINNNSLAITALQSPDSIDFNDVTGTEPAWTPGQAYYAGGTFNIHGEYDGVTLQLGQEQYIKCANVSGLTIPNGKPVYVTGVSAGWPAIDLAQADTFEKSRCIGITTMAIADGETGLVTTIGSVSDLNTNALTPGATIFLSDTVAGEITETPPDIATSLGTTIIADLTVGKVFVKINNHINPPAVLAYMSGGVLTSNTITAAYQDIVNYVSHDNVYMTYDPTAGSITVPSDGTYRITINMGLLFDTVGNGEETFILRVNGDINGNRDIGVAVGRNGGTASAYPSISFGASAGEVIKLQLGGASVDLTTLTETLMSFEIESTHIR